MNFYSTAEQFFCVCGVKPAPGVFPGLCMVRGAAGKFQFRQLTLESEKTNPMHFTSRINYKSYIAINKYDSSKFLLLGCPCLSKNQAFVNLSVYPDL